MAQCWLSGRRQSKLASLLTGIVLIFSNDYATAQIIPDRTLGAESSVVKPNVNINSATSDLIDGGAIRGNNLFHSFQEFNVGEGLQVYFINPEGIENILGRVTGTNSSNILGKLGVLGNANLFLLNPNGIIFGPNAQLDIAGSFLASTANSLVFGNGLEFSATKPEAPPLLTIKVRPGLQYGTNQARGTIANTGNLVVGQNLTLSAGNLDLQGQLYAGGDLTLQAGDTVRVRDSVTKPFIAAAGGELLVQGDRIVDIFALNHPASGLASGGNMVLRSANTVGGDAHYWTGGNFRIEQLDGSLGDLFSPYDPIIRSVGDVEFNNYAGTSLHILAGGSVTISGVVAITAPETGTDRDDFLDEKVTLSNGTVIPIDGSKRPTLDVRAGVNPAAIAQSGLTGDNFPPDLFFSLVGSIPIPDNTLPPNPSQNTPTSADIKIGGIVMLGRNAANGLVFLTNQYQPNRSLSGGNIEVGAIITRDDISQFLNPLSDKLRNLLDLADLQDSFTGNGGDVIVDSRLGIILNGTGLPRYGINFGVIDTSSSTGNAGNITLIANDTVSLANSLIVSNTNGSGQGGSVNINAADSVNLTGTGNINPFIDKIKNGIFPSNLSDLPSGIFAVSTGTGIAGDVKIETGRFIVKDGAAVLASASSTGQGGNLDINASDSVTVNNAALLTGTLGAGNAGNLTISTPNLMAQNQAVITTSTVNAGKAGDLTITSEQVTVRDNAGIAVETRGSGDAGNLTINTGKLAVDNEANISISSISKLDAGRAGTLTVNSSESVTLSNLGTILAQTRNTQPAGDVTINTQVLSVFNGGGVAAFTTSSGRGGNVIIKATDSVELSGTSTDGLSPSVLFVGTSGAGDGGSLQIDTTRLTIQNGAAISGATSPNSTGRGGSLTINASDSIILSGTSANNLIASGLSVDTTGTGVGGDLTLNTRRLLIQDGAGISASTFSPSATGQGGSVTVNARESIELKGTSQDGQFPSGLYAQTFSDANAGDLNIVTGELIVQDGARVSVSGSGSQDFGNIVSKINTILNAFGPSPGKIESRQGSGNAGDIKITTDTIFLNNQGQIVAETFSGEGGNINLDVKHLLLMRDQSLISTTAGRENAGGNGGNITIKSPLIVAVPKENSDITANAFLGNGGRVQITTQGIYGLQFRPRLTPRSDITASSEFGVNGTVEINTPDIDPTRGLGNLPEEPTTPEVDQVCQPGTSQTASEFTITGRGGKPPNPSEPLSSNAGWRDSRSATSSSENHSSSAEVKQPTRPRARLVEAQGWIINAKGQVELIAEAPTVTPYSSWTTPVNCSDRNNTVQP